MYLSRFLEKLFKKNGFLLVDANSNRYIIGKPKKEKPITIKLLDKKLHYKLLLFPELYFGEAYADGSVVIENGESGGAVAGPVAIEVLKSLINE